MLVEQDHKGGGDANSGGEEEAQPMQWNSQMLKKEAHPLLKLLPVLLRVRPAAELFAPGRPTQATHVNMQREQTDTAHSQTAAFETCVSTTQAWV